MAEQDLDLDVETEEDAGKGGGGKIIVIAIVAVLLLSSAVLAALYFTGMLGGASKEAASAEAGAEDAPAATAAAARANGPLIYQPLEPPFVVNFNADADVRFMQITIQAADRDPAVIETIKEHNPAIRNGLVMLFSSQDPSVLNTREGKEQLRQDALNEVRSVLKQMTGKGKLENLYFTSFVMQ